MAFKRLVDFTLKKTAPIGSEDQYEEVLDTLAEMVERKDPTLKESAEYLAMELQVEAYEESKSGKEE